MLKTKTICKNKLKYSKTDLIRPIKNIIKQSQSTVTLKMLSIPSENKELFLTISIKSYKANFTRKGKKWLKLFKKLIMLMRTEIKLTIKFSH